MAKRISLASGKPNRDRSDTPPVPPRPDLTPALARQLVQLLHAGVPALTCLAYLAPDYHAALTLEQRKAWYLALVGSRAVLDAARELNGGDWQTLDADRRLTLALDKHFAELAHYLYTHDYAEADGNEAKKISEARAAITEKLRGDSEGDDTPFTRMMRDLMEGKLRDADLAPPTAAATASATGIPIELATRASKKKTES